jgi:enoyl-CoA hydratase/carnithine racemase
MQLALAADQRIATPDCQLSVREGQWGLVPDMGLTRSLRGLVQLDVAKELTFSARIIDGEAAKSLGLVTHLAEEPFEAAMALAREYAQRSPDAVLAAKRVLDAMVHAPWRSLRTEKWWQLKLMMGRNFRIAMGRTKTPERAYEPRQYR